MDIIPKDVKDFNKFISEHREEITNGIYKIGVACSWVKNLTQKDLEFVLKYGISNVDHIIAANTDQVSILEKLSKYGEEVRYEVAKNPYTPINILEDLTRDSNLYVRQALTKNTKIPAQILDTLANDTEYSVRLYLSECGRTSSKALDILAMDYSTKIRHHVALHKNTTTKALDILSRDADTQVRAIAERRLHPPPEPGMNLPQRLFVCFIFIVIVSIIYISVVIYLDFYEFRQREGCVSC